MSLVPLRARGVRKRPTSAAQLKVMRENVRALCTQSPGVYRMVSDDGEVVYVGKSRKLRSRLLSYFRASWPGDKAARIVREASAIEWEYTPSEFAALLTELHAIKRFRPRLNVAMKRDARNYAFVKLTRGPAPKLLVVRGAGSEDGGMYYGPYQGARRVNEAVRELNDVLGLRDCSLRTRMHFSDQRELFVIPPRTPACIRHEIGKCLGPCIAACSADEYEERTVLARLFLEGESDGPLDTLRVAMTEASAQMEYERAGVMRDKLQRLEDLRESLARMRFAVESLTFVYRVPGHAGDDRIYLVRRGRVRAEMKQPRSRADWREAERVCTEVFGVPDVESPARVPAHEVDELLLMSSWFRRFPAELERTSEASKFLKARRSR
ncbi:MAG TPA: GIY-YIG nuclease family protein [Gemmatimonadales bacterium]|nr:GIY-YIG nuclease family protein [Gemmatimonadales bacterium]